MKHANFWTDDYPRPVHLKTSPLPERVDVAIVGGGYTGLHAALALCDAGASVAVIEAKTIGWGASSRNGGMATSGLKLEMPAVFARYGAERGRAFWKWAQDAIRHVEETVHGEGIDCHFARSGCVLLASKAAHYRRFAEEIAWQRRELGVEDAYAVAPERVHEEMGVSGYFGGMVDVETAALHPARYVFGLAEAAARRGACLVEDAPVTSLQREGRAWRLVTRQGSLSAGAVLLATNGYTGDLVPGVRRGIFPAGSYIITTEPLSPDMQREVSPRGRMAFDSRHLLSYFRLTPDGRMLFGGRHDLSTTIDMEASARQLRERLVKAFPQLHDAPISHAWTGKLGLTFDLMPHAGRVEGVWYAMGYCGHGVAVASKLGREVGEWMAGRGEPSLFAGIPHRRYPWTPYERLYLPFVAAWFRILDRVG